MLSYVANHSKPLNYKSDQIGRQNDLKCWVTSQNIQNNAKLQKWSNDLHRFDVKAKNFESDQNNELLRFDVQTIKMLSYVAEHSKQRDQKTMIASIWCQNDQSNAKLQTRSNSDEFASIWSPNDQKCWVTSQTIQNR